MAILTGTRTCLPKYVSLRIGGAPARLIAYCLRLLFFVRSRGRILFFTGLQV